MLNTKLRRPVLLVLTILVTGLSLAQAGGSAPAKSSQKGSKKALTQEEMLAKYSYEQLDAASTYLFAVIESHQDAQLQKKKRKPLLSCDPSKAQADTLLSGPLRSLLDEKRPAEVKAYEAWLAQAPSSGDPGASKWANCSATCSCAAFLAVVNDAKVPQGKEAIHTKVSDRLTAENSKQTSASTAKCAAQQKWYCGSPLQQYLKSELSGH